MIYDRLENAEQYYGLHPNFKKAMEYLKAQDCEHMAPGDYETGDPDFTFRITEGASTPGSASLIGAHRRRGEIWLQLTSTEQIKWANISGCETAVPYDEEKDFAMYSAPSHTVFPLLKGHFAVMMPSDGHAHESIDPGTIVRKVVMWFAL